MERFPIQLAIEITDTGEFTDHIALIAFIGSERQELASTDKMTGYGATQDPVECARLLLLDILGLDDELKPPKSRPITNEQVREALAPFMRS